MLPALRGETDDGWLQQRHCERDGEREREVIGRQTLTEMPNMEDNG